MTIYYIFYIILFGYAIISSETKSDTEIKNRNICVLGFGMLIIMIALRHPSMGTDLGWARGYGYLSSFEELNTYSWDRIIKLRAYLNYEKGYVIFNKLVGTIYNNEQFFLAVCAILSMLPVGIFVFKRSKIPLVSICMFIGFPVFLMYYSGLRQIIAIGITVISIRFVEKKQIVAFVLFVLFAWTFHSSAIVFLIAYPMYYIRLKDTVKLVLCAAIPVVYVFRKSLFLILSKLFKDNAKVHDTGAFTLFIFFILIYLFLIFFNRDDKEQDGLINLCYLACICQAFSGIYDTAMRVGYYFMIYMMVAVPNTIYNMKMKEVSKKQEYVLSYMIIVLFFVIYALRAISVSTWAHANPYHFFWESVL